MKPVFMSLKRIPTDKEIDALAEQFRPLWRQGDIVRPWLRQHRDILLDLVHGGWSWASVGQALTKAGITYRTGKPWTDKWLRSEFSRAQIPLKGYRRRQSDAERSTAIERSVPSAAAAPPTPPPLTLPHVPSSPRFKPASFRATEPPRAPSEAERTEIERNHRLTFGPPDSKE
ncbi:MAG: hypothetical protein B7Z81_10375 [Acidocella sp. 20-61-6]|nr:MAG: hypothetical protein B7Z81_10375 [Acidocella sp. 20-61-6]